MHPEETFFTLNEHGMFTFDDKAGLIIWMDPERVSKCFGSIDVFKKCQFSGLGKHPKIDVLDFLSFIFNIALFLVSLL